MSGVHRKGEARPRSLAKKEITMTKSRHTHTDAVTHTDTDAVTDTDADTDTDTDTDTDADTDADTGTGTEAAPRSLRFADASHVRRYFKHPTALCLRENAQRVPVTSAQHLSGVQPRGEWQAP